MSTAQRIAVVMPAYNAERYVRSAIESVLAQTCADFTLYVFDDGSTDATAQIVRSIADPRLRLIGSARNQGGAATRQRALATVEEEWVAYLDADDLARPDRLEKQRATVAAHPGLVVLGSALECIDELGRSLGFRRYPLDASAVLRRLPIENCIAQPAAFFHRPTALRAGGYPPGPDGAEDYSLWLRMGRLGAIANHPAPLTRYRLHAAQFKSTRTRQQILQTLKTRLEARRLGYPTSLAFWASWTAQAALLALPPALVRWLFVKRTLRRELPR